MGDPKMKANEKGKHIIHMDIQYVYAWLWPLAVRGKRKV